MSGFGVRSLGRGCGVRVVRGRLLRGEVVVLSEREGEFRVGRMAEASGAELVALFEKASKAADRAVQDGAVLAAEEARCTDALKAMGAMEVSTALLMSTQVCVWCGEGFGSLA